MMKPIAIQPPLTDPITRSNPTNTPELNIPTKRPELLAPAGSWDCAMAAIENGADAIYFGVDRGFNARHRAANFGLGDLPELMSTLRQRGVRGYVTLNTLVFPRELPSLIEVVEKIAESGVDAVLVQDFGVARIVSAMCRELEIHASTQMSLTSAETITEAADLGLARVVLARELSIDEIRKIRSATDMPLEAFIHGALCVAYSGQCLTSESLGGRSANRGQCAQACRLPYELVCDGKDRDLGDVRYLLSPQDLAGYAAIPDMIVAGIDSLKIEGRLKTPEYVANITGHYRRAIDQAVQTGTVALSRQDRQEMELSFSRGFAPGWLEGNDHKRLVPGIRAAKQGIVLGNVIEHRDDEILVQIAADVSLGDGLAIASNLKPFAKAWERSGAADAYAGSGFADNHQGGRVYSLRPDRPNRKRGGMRAEKQKTALAGQTVWIGFKRGELDLNRLSPAATVFKNDDPKLNKRLASTFGGKPRRTRGIDWHVTARTGKPLRVTATINHNASDTDAARDDNTVTVASTEPLEKATTRPVTREILIDKLGRLGGTPFHLGEVHASISGDPIVPLTVLNQLRRDVVELLTARLNQPPARTIDRAAANRLLAGLESLSGQPSEAPENPESKHPATEKLAPEKPAAMMTVLCRTMVQLEAAVRCPIDEVIADFHDVRDHKIAVEVARAAGIPIRLASIRMQKPGETGLLKQIVRYAPDGILARNLAAIRFGLDAGIEVVADFSLNVANHRSAEWLIERGVRRVTASYDLNADQLEDLVAATPSRWLEVVMHQHMPMFHMEHCVFCSVLSPGTNKTNCGRPCDRHVVQLRDRVGKLHTLQADIACRNTLYNATPQSAADIVTGLIGAGVGWFRVELLEEDALRTELVLRLYRGLLAGEVDGQDVWRQLAADNRVGVTRGTLEAKRNPLAIL